MEESPPEWIKTLADEYRGGMCGVKPLKASVKERPAKKNRTQEPETDKQSTRMAKVELIVVMGPSGCGKSTLGEWLAGRLNAELLEGDSFHPAANIAKMSQNIPLNDDDRWPWLNSMRSRVQSEAEKHAQNSVLYIVISCSALKKSYRDRFRNIPGVKTSFVFLHGSYELLLDRMQKRKNHYMKADMLRSQVDTLEIPDGSETDVFTIPLEDEQRSDKNAIFKLLFP